MHVKMYSMLEELSGLGIEQSIYQCLRKADRVLTNIYDRSLNEHGIRITQFSILRAVNEMVGVSSRELQDHLILNQTTLSRNLKPLLRANYLEVSIGKDRRQRYLRLTAEGKRLFNAAEKSWSKTQQKIKNSLGPDITEKLFSVGFAVVNLKQ